MPTSGKAAARTALPQPPRTSQKVPRNSAASRFEIATIAPLPLYLHFNNILIIVDGVERA
jgi:hypothetical protein